MSFDNNEKKLSIFRKIFLWWKFEGKYYHKDLYQGIRNIIRWFPVIWKDRDWDDHYIWQVMMTKLTFQAKYIREKGLHVDNVRDAEKMELCVRLMKLISDEFYTGEYMDYHKSKFHFDPVTKEELDEMSEDKRKLYEDCSTLRIEEIWEKYDDYFKKYPHAYKEVTKTDKYIFDNKSKQTIAMNMGYYLHNKARRILFTLLERNIESWWD